MARLGRNSLVKLFVVIFFLMCCHMLLVRQDSQILAVDSRNPILLELDALIQQALHIANTSTSLYKFSGRNATLTELQKFLGCLVHIVTEDGDVEADHALSLYSSLKTDTACDNIRSTSLSDSWDTSVLCRHLIGMKILIVGSHLTYRLHDKLLDILPSGSQGSQFRCHAPALCTWHEICSPSPSQPHISFSSERRRMPPRDLSNSAILRFSMSSTLFNNAPDEVHKQPYVDPLTNVREYSALDWFEKARRSDMIILSKSPVPAPAWSYLLSNRSNTHRFNVKIPRPGSPEWNRVEPYASLLIRQGILRDSSAVQAAWRATIVKWFPELIESLIHLGMEKAAMKGKQFVWLGSSFFTSCATEQERHMNQTEISWIQACFGCDDRCIYNNAQGVLPMIEAMAAVFYNNRMQFTSRIYSYTRYFPGLEYYTFLQRTPRHRLHL